MRAGVILLSLCALTQVFALAPFEIVLDPEKRMAEVKARDAEVRRQIDFPALLAFVQSYAQKRGKIEVGPKADRYEVDLAREMPRDVWKLADLLHNIYRSGHWSWELSGSDIALGYYDYAVRVSIQVRVISREQFEVQSEDIEDRRDILDG